MKTIFYLEANDGNVDKWFNDKPYKEWFTLDDFLYHPDGNIAKYTLDDNRIIKKVIPGIVKDEFSKDGIVRRIALFIL